jgi:hypothetical protein
MKTISIPLHELIIKDKDSGEVFTIRTLRPVEDITREVCGREEENLRERIEDEYEPVCIRKGAA